jgi:hypothetical protein
MANHLTADHPFKLTSLAPIIAELDHEAAMRLMPRPKPC